MEISATPRGRIGTALFITGVFFIATAPVFWLRLTLPAPNQPPPIDRQPGLYEYSFPMAEYMHNRLSNRQLPLWNPYQLCGTPAFVTPGEGISNPFNLTLAFLPPVKALPLQAFIALALLGLLSFLMLCSFSIRRTAALLGAVVFTFSGTAAALMAQPVLMATLAWYPGVLWCINRYGQTGAARWSGWAGVFLGLMILGGAWYLAAILTGFSVLWAGYHYFTHRKEGLHTRKSVMRHGIMVAAIALGFSAMQWIPTVIWCFYGQLPAIWTTQQSFTGRIPNTMADLFSASLACFPESTPAVFYCSISGLLLLPAALWHSRKGKAVFFFILAGAGLCSLSLYGDRLLPAAFPLDLLYLPATLSLAIVAAFGADFLLAYNHAPRGVRHYLAMLSMLAAAGGLFLLFSSDVQGRAFITALLLLPPFVFRKRWVGVFFGALLIFIVFTDLSFASKYVLRHPVLDFPQCYQLDSDAWKTTVAQANHQRILMGARPDRIALTPNSGMISEVNVAGGAHLAATHEQHFWWNKLLGENSTTEFWALQSNMSHYPLLNFMSVSSVVIPKDHPMASVPPRWKDVLLREYQHTDTAIIYLNDSVQPRCSWVPGWVVAGNTRIAFDKMLSPDFDPLNQCVVMPDKPAFPNLLQHIPEGKKRYAPDKREHTKVAITMEKPEKITLNVTAPKAGITLLLDTHTPGWQARLDGVKAPVLKVNGMFRGVVTPAGNHVIEFRYQPFSFWVGLTVSVFTLALLLLSGLRLLGKESAPE